MQPSFNNHSSYQSENINIRQLLATPYSPRSYFGSCSTVSSFVLPLTQRSSSLTSSIKTIPHSLVPTVYSSYFALLNPSYSTILSMFSDTHSQGQLDIRGPHPLSNCGQGSPIFPHGISPDLSSLCICTATPRNLTIAYTRHDTGCKVELLKNVSRRFSLFLLQVTAGSINCQQVLDVFPESNFDDILFPFQISSVWEHREHASSTVCSKCTGNQFIRKMHNFFVA